MIKLDPEDRVTPEELAAIDVMIAEGVDGDPEAFMEASSKVRCLPGSLLALKEVFGADFIRKWGFNTALADKHLGQGWLDA